MPAPDQFVLRNDAIAVKYSAATAGSIRQRGPLGLTCTDGTGDEAIPLADVHTVDCGRVGTLVTVTLSAPRADGDTTFSMLLPAVELGNETSVPLQVPAITAHTGHPPRGDVPQTTYSVTMLTGTAYRQESPAVPAGNRSHFDLEELMLGGAVALANVT